MAVRSSEVTDVFKPRGFTDRCNFLAAFLSAVTFTSEVVDMGSWHFAWSTASFASEAGPCRRAEDSSACNAAAAWELLFLWFLLVS